VKYSQKKKSFVNVTIMISKISGQKLILEAKKQQITFF